MNLDKRAPIGVGIVVRRGHYVLMGKRKGAHAPGTWSLPGGKPDAGERPWAAAARELREETSIHVPASSLRQLPMWTYDRFEEDQLHYVTLYFDVEAPPAAHAVLTEPEKCEGWVWVTANYLPAPLFAGAQAAVKAAFA